jgi:redox-sensitive bicupin YhaK (pirin superfamily)
MATTIYHSADSRGSADHGWLKAKHTFSFAGYYDPSRIHFGALRVLNDDEVAPGMGFSTHPHENMEIITIPLEGQITHKDSMGNHGTITAGEVQVMSAGTGIMHSEMNGSHREKLRLLQIWVFPDKENVQPRYDQLRYPELSENQLVQILSPNADDAGVWIHQQAWFHLAKISAGGKVHYPLHKPGSNGVYVFVIEGGIEIEGHKLNTRDGLGISDTAAFDVHAESASTVLFMEVPMIG